MNESNKWRSLTVTILLAILVAVVVALIVSSIQMYFFQKVNIAVTLPITTAAVLAVVQMRWRMRSTSD